MDGRPILARIVRLLEEQKLEAILIGNAAAALQGAPVTTVDFDFMFRRTPANVRKLVALTTALGGIMLRPYYPASGLIRIMRDEEGLQLDFMSTIDGVRSFESLRSRSREVNFDGAKLLVACLADLIKSKKAAGRPRDRAVLEILERALHETEAYDKKRKAGGAEEGK